VRTCAVDSLPTTPDALPPTIGAVPATSAWPQDNGRMGVKRAPQRWSDSTRCRREVKRMMSGLEIVQRGVSKQVMRVSKVGRGSNLEEGCV
jgi:hypothetical protein